MAVLRPATTRHPPAKGSGKPRKGVRRFLHDNGLTIVLTALFLGFWAGLTAVGHRDYNHEQREHGQQEIGYAAYLRSAHFWEATAENWESEFLQLFSYVMLTAVLFQKGSSESKNPDETEDVDRDPRASRDRADAPWPVRRGGLILKLYEHSLSLAFLLLFVVSLAAHAVAGASEYSDEQSAHGRPVVSVLQYVGSSRFWNESLQNWQSEFLAIALMVLLSIFLRQRGSPESKPVDSPHGETGRG